MKIRIAKEEFKLSKAQSKVVQSLLDNRDWVVTPSIYHNHQSFLSRKKDGLFHHVGQQFKKPTLNWLKERNILVPISESGYPRLKLNPLAHRIFEATNQ